MTNYITGTVSDIEEYLTAGRRAHLIGIGGVSMSSLAELLSGAGLTVTGSDMSDSETVKKLRGLGIHIDIGHSGDNLGEAELVIRTAAARDDNPEIVAAREKGLPVFERAQTWGAIMRGYKNAICISGTHGKTTTTSMTTHVLMAAGCDPTVMIGGTLPLLQSGHRVGAGDSIVLESCEYCNSFHSFFPTIAVVLNIDNDHLDFFKDLEHIKESFRYFASLVPEGGHIIACGDDKNTMGALTPLNRPLLTFGLGSGCDVTAANIVREGGVSYFDVICSGAFYAHVSLQVPGDHNITNALAAAAVAYTLGLDGGAVGEGLRDFSGAGRRFEPKGELNGAKIYDDYAHHPGELRALLNTVKNLDYERIILAFQPHTYTRTKALLDDFAEQLCRADIVLLADIYAAREQNTVGISSGDLAAKIPQAVYLPDFGSIEDRLRTLARGGDIIITVGAGDIYKVGERLAFGN